MANYRCETCKEKFDKLSELMRHQRISGHLLQCKLCSKTFTQKKNLDNHLKRHSDQYNCELCKAVFNREDNLKRHKQCVHQIGRGAPMENVYDPNTDPKQYYELEKTEEKKIRKFNTTTATYKATFQDIAVTKVSAHQRYDLQLAKESRSFIHNVSKYVI